MELVKFIVPKFVSGRMPPRNVQHGASAMTSAEEALRVPATLTFVVAVQLAR